MGRVGQEASNPCPVQAPSPVCAGPIHCLGSDVVDLSNRKQLCFLVLQKSTSVDSGLGTCALPILTFHAMALKLLWEGSR